MTTPAPHTPDEREYDAAADSRDSWLLAISELRRQHLAREQAPETKAPGDG